MNVLALSLCENLRWGLIKFDQFIWASTREKPVFGGLRTTKTQASLRIRTD